MVDIAPGSISDLRSILTNASARTVVVFAGGSSFEGSGAAKAIERATEGVVTRLVRDIPENPDLATVNAAIDTYRAAPPDAVIAIGGGSVMDLAKVVNAVAPLADDARPYVTGAKTLSGGSVPLIAVPTTSGTGSEATRYAVVTVDGVKLPMGDVSLLPVHVILDPELTYTIPPGVTASTGLDALAQAMEAMWSVRSDDASNEPATRGLVLALANIERAVNNPDPGSRTAMMEAAYLSGVAIDTTATTAPHALSYRLTTEHGVPHGHAVALTLGAVLEYNAGVTSSDVNDARGVDHVRAAVSAVCDVLGVPDPTAGRRLLYDLIAGIGLDPTFAGVGADSPEARAVIVESVSPARLANNPRAFPGDSLSKLIASIP